MWRDPRPRILCVCAKAGRISEKDDMLNDRSKRIITSSAEITLRTDTGRSRRILAFACVVCMAVLQCFMVLPAFTDQVYAAGDLVIGAEYQDDYSTYANKTISESFIDGVSDRVEVTIEGEEGEEPIVLEGPKLKAVLSEAGLSSKIDRVEVGGQDVKWSDSSYFIVSDESGYQLYRKSGSGADLVVEGFGDIYVKRSSSVKPVSFSKKPQSNNSSPTVGDTIKVTYKLSVDKFYKESDDYDSESATALTWTGNDKVKILTSSTSGTSGTVKAKVKKSGSITIAPDSAAFPELTSGVTVSFTGQPTTTKATTTTTTTTRYTTRYPSTTRSTYTPYRPTVRTGAGVSTTRSSTSAPTTATRPTQTSETLAPSFQTIKVKEVYLNAPAQDPESGDAVFYDEYGNPVEEDPMDETEPGEEDSSDYSGVTFPAAAGSAAVAAAACGAGAVGRIRRFRFDMSDAAAAVTTGLAAAGGKGRFGKGGKGPGGSAGGASGKPAGASGSAPEEKKSRNPLSKIRRKS